MKKKSLLILLFISLLASNMVAQQSGTFVERLSFDASAGYIIPIAPDNGLSTSDFAGFRNFYVAANYELTDLWGLRLSYANNGFQDKNDSSLGVTHHKFMLEGTFNIIEWFEMQRKPLEVVLHGGAGMSLGKSKMSSDLDKMGTLQIGVMPLYRITDNFSLHLDATYVVNIKQNYGYNGLSSKMDSNDVTGSYFVMNFGLGVSFGF